MNVLVVTSMTNDLEQLQAAVDSKHFQLSVTDEPDVPRMLASGMQFGCVLIRVTASAAADLQNIAKIKDRWPTLPIVAYGNQWQIPNIVQAIKLGADEVCEFPCSSSDLSSLLNRISSNDSNRQPMYSDVIPPEILKKLKSDEARILHLLVRGRTTKQVGATLEMSIRTVHYRKKELLRKLGVQNRSEAIELIRLSSNDLFNGLSSNTTLC